MGEEDGHGERKNTEAQGLRRNGWPTGAGPDITTRRVCRRLRARGGQKMSRERYKAIIYREKVDKAGNVTLEKVTTSRWLTVTQIASSVGVTPQTMYRQIVDGGAMPFTRIGSQIRVSVDDFLKWMESCQCAEYERPGAL